MKIEEFENEVQAYYSKNWNSAQKKAVSQWLAKKSERIIGLVFAELLKSFSTRFKSAPVISEFEEALKTVRKERADEMVSQVIIPDIRENGFELDDSEINELLSNLTWRKRANKDS